MKIVLWATLFSLSIYSAPERVPSPAEKDHGGASEKHAEGLPPFPELGPNLPADVREVREFVNEPKNAERIKAILKKIPKDAHPHRRAYGETDPDFDLLAWAKQKKAEHPQMTPTQLAVSLAVLEYGGLAVTGKMDPKGCKAARDHAYSMAKRKGQYHGSAMHALGGTASEIVAESFANYPNLMDSARSCVEPKQNGWVNSNNHAKRMFPRMDKFCCDMARGTNGVYYCVCIVSGAGVKKFY